MCPEVGRSVKLGRCASTGSATSAAPPRCCARSPAPPRGCGLPPPAALTGDWFGSCAVIAPTVRSRPSTPPRRSPCPRRRRAGAVGGGWIGYLSYPDAGADGRGRGFPRPPAAGRTACCACDRRRHAGGTKAFPVHRCRTGCRARCHRAGAAAAVANRLDARPTATRTAPACWPAWRRSPPARSTRPACARSSPERVQRLAAGLLRRRRRPHRTRARGLSRRASWGAVASLSPELFLRRRGDVVTSSPIKGTLPLHCRPVGAAGVGQGRRREHHDRRPGPQRPGPGRGHRDRSRVPELLAVRPAPGRVASGVDGVGPRAPPSCRCAALLDATFPPASVTGTPKDRARQLLSQWEPRRRGIYCGTVGLASPIAGTELNVAIRTVEFDARGGAVLGVGGGITADSDPRRRMAGMPAQGGADRRRSRRRSSRLPRTQHRVVELSARDGAPGCAAITWAQASLTRMPVGDQRVDLGHQRRRCRRSASRRPAPR